jgi:hypothetical protein
MDTASIPIPGALRLRPLRPLLEPDGSCRRVFDLERGAEVEVPPELRLHVAPALECGDFDEELLDWLVSAGLITSEGRQPSPSEEAGRAGDWAERDLLRLDGELHARFDLRAEEALLPELDLAFAEARGGARLVLHLGSGGAFPNASALERLVVEAERRVIETGLDVHYELALAPHAVTAGIVRFVAEMPFHLRLACEVPTGAETSRRAWKAAEAAAGLVLDGIPHRLTFQAVMGPGARLRDLWSWARERHLLHLDVLLLGAHPRGAAAPAVAAYRRDLRAAAEAFAADLAHDLVPLDLQPLTAIARRVLRSAGADQPYRSRASVPVRPPAGAAAIVVAQPLDSARLLPQRRAAALDAAHCLSAPPRDETASGPAPRRCSLQRAEAEAAVLLARLLAGPPAAFALRLLDEMARAPVDPFSHLSWPAQSLTVC